MNIGPLVSDDLVEYLSVKYAYLLKDKDVETVSIVNRLKSLPLINKIFSAENEKSILFSNLIKRQRAAVTYKEWYDISCELDKLLDYESWKEDPKSTAYDYELIADIVSQMRNARENGDFKLLLYLIRTNWVRNLGNMGDLCLYRRSFVGTKRLIEEYNQECYKSLEYLLNNEDVKLDDSYLLGILVQTRKNIGRTALVLSGGSTFGVFHIGVLITLLEAGLLPKIISGSSAGSIMAGILCCHGQEEIIGLLNTVIDQKFNIFGDESLESPEEDTKNGFKKLLSKLGHLLKYGTLFDTKGLKETMTGFVGDLTFREAYNRTGRILNITVSPTSNYEQTRLLNYLTAPNCLIWSAVCASCSLPGVFPSTSIYEKVPDTNEIQEWNNDLSTKYVDGSVDNDLPIARLSEMFNVDHIIACQVNPHVVPILKISVSSIGGEVENDLSYKFKQLLNDCYDFFTNEILHYMQLLNELDIQKTLANKVTSILSQNYSGDITILPDFRAADFQKIFQNPTKEFLLDFIMRGARASWPKITIISNHCGVEFALDKSISILRGRLIPSSKTTTSSGVINGMRRFDRAMSLVNSPIDCAIKDRRSPSREHSRSLVTNPLSLQRHNSANEPVKLTGCDISGRKSDQIATPRKQRHSTTALSSMASDILGFNSNSAEVTFVEDDFNAFGHFNEKNTKEINNEKVSSTADNDIDDQYLNPNSLSIDRFANKLSNKYADFDYDKEEIIRTPVQSRDKGSANLPIVTNSNSSKNSNSTIDKLRSTPTSSSSLAKDYNPIDIKVRLMSLASPDIRRKYVKSYKLENSNKAPNEMKEYEKLSSIVLQKRKDKLPSKGSGVNLKKFNEEYEENLSDDISKSNSNEDCESTEAYFECP